MWKKKKKKIGKKMVRDFGKAGQFLPPLPLDPPPSSTLDSEISVVVYIKHIQNRL